MLPFCYSSQRESTGVRFVSEESWRTFFEDISPCIGNSGLGSWFFLREYKLVVDGSGKNLCFWCSLRMKLCSLGRLGVTRTTNINTFLRNQFRRTRERIRITRLPLGVSCGLRASRPSGMYEIHTFFVASVSCRLSFRNLRWTYFSAIPLAYFLVHCDMVNGERYHT